LVKQGGRVEILADPVHPIGFHQFMKPVIHEISLEEGTIIVTFTDGILHAGRKYGRQLRLDTFTTMMMETDASGIQLLTDQMFELALNLDEGRPADDMTLLTLGVHSANESRVGRLRVTYPM
jgi:serine phosphatase RsbU (regulator of sigma subunit)